MYYEKNIERIIEKISIKYGLPRNTVSMIIASEFKKLKEVITDEEYKSIQLIHLGKFQVSKKRINNINKDK